MTTERALRRRLMTALAEGPRSRDELAAVLNENPGRVVGVLTALSRVGLVREVIGPEKTFVWVLSTSRQP